MNVNAGTIAVAPRSVARSVLALAAVLAIGAAAGSLVTRAVTADALETPPIGIASWDQQKLQSMDGRQAAETVEAPAIGIAPWDDQKLDAMEGLQAAAGR
jgi:hypothetical protein